MFGARSNGALNVNIDINVSTLTFSLVEGEVVLRVATVRA